MTLRHCGNNLQPFPSIPGATRTALAYWTTSWTVALRVTLPLLPLILKLKVPVEVALLVLIVIVDVPWPVTELGLKLALELDGNPRTRNVTAPLKPLIAATVIV